METRSRRNSGGISLSSNTSTEAWTPTSTNRMSNTLLPCRLVIWVGKHWGQKPAWRQLCFHYTFNSKFENNYELYLFVGHFTVWSVSVSPQHETICLYSEPDILSHKKAWIPETLTSPGEKQTSCPSLMRLFCLFVCSLSGFVHLFHN